MTQWTAFTTFEVARLCGVYPSTVANWVKGKKLKAFATPGGHRRILKEDLVEFIRKHRFPMPDKLKNGKKRVLVVEDEPEVGRMLCRALQKACREWEVRLFGSGIKALLEMGKRPVDLLILDVVMPVMDGEEVLDALRSDPRTQKIKVIGITGKKLSPKKLRFMKSHSDAFYFKPFDVKELAQKAMSLLGVEGRETAGAG